MLSIKAMDPAAVDYYIDSVAQHPEDYYTGKGEAPGRWVGGGVGELGLSGTVEPEDFRALFAGNDPRSDGKATPLSEHAVKVPGYDCTWSAPKSVSVMWALGDADLQARLGKAHDEAVDTGVAYLERVAAYGRRGRGGSHRIATKGFVASSFRHRTSRDGDMQLHTHVVISNYALAADGKWSALDGHLLYDQAMSAAAIYRAQLRHNLRELGLEWSMREDGLAEIDGVPRKVLRAFSKRRVAIEKELERRGLTGPEAAQAATLDTRKAKELDIDPTWIEARWTAEALELGFGREQIAALLELGRERLGVDGTDVEVLHQAAVDAILDPPPADPLAFTLALTERKSTFDERDVIRQLAKALPDGIDSVDLLRLVREVCDRDPRVVPVDAPEQVLRKNDGLQLPTGMAVARYTTLDMLQVEHQLVESADARRRAMVAQVRPDTAGLAIGEARGGLGLSGEQAHMVRALTMDGAGVAVVNALAGAGKTTALGAATKAWQREGIPVLGATLSAKAAGILRDETGMRTFTTTRLLMDLQDPRWPGFAPGTVLVVDEAGQVGSRTLAFLHDNLEAADGKLVLVGDDRQLPEIDAGGAFRGLAERLDTIRLTENRRQVDPEIRERLLEMRSGEDPAAALRAWDADGLVVREADNEQMVLRQVTDWSQAWLAAGPGGKRSLAQARDDVVMLGLTNNDVAGLNAYARLVLEEAGVITGDELLCDRIGFRTGDHVVTRDNKPMLGVMNGERWEVEAVDLDARVIALRHIGDPSRQVVLPAWYWEDHLQHGYAITVNIAQGLTVDRAFLRGSDATYREALYVAASRARHETRFYVVAGRDEEVGCAHVHGVHVADDADPFEQLLKAAGRSRMQTMAVDSAQLPEVPWVDRGTPQDLGIDVA